MLKRPKIALKNFMIKATITLNSKVYNKVNVNMSMKLFIQMAKRSTSKIKNDIFANLSKDWYATNKIDVCSI